MVAAQQSPAPTSTIPPLPEVTVEAQRLQLAPRVSQFVYRITIPNAGYDGGLARWEAPVCPLVAGLRRQEGGIIQRRVAEIARAAGVRTADEHCRPNLFILVTAQPQKLLQKMQSGQHYLFWFGKGALPADIHDFITTPRPVQVWYAKTVSESGTGPSAPEGTTGASKFLHADATRVKLNVVYGFARVFVMVDWSRLEGASLRQLADYVGMVSLAEVDLTAHLGDAPTILKLFAGTPETVPSGLSGWDQAFLSALYATDQYSKKQRGQIERTILEEVSR